MEQSLVLNNDRTHILVKKNNELPDDKDIKNIAEFVGKYIYKENNYNIYILNKELFNHKFINIKDFNEFDLPFVVYNRPIIMVDNTIKTFTNTKYQQFKLLKSISNILLIVIIMILVLILINYINKNYNIEFTKIVN